jgi:hypothetical protein
VIAYRYSTIIYWTKFPFKKSDFHLSNGVFPIFCYEISATALAGKFCVARRTRDSVTQKLRLSSVSFLSVYLSSVIWWLEMSENHLVKYLDQVLGLGQNQFSPWTGSKLIHLTLRSDLFVWNVISYPTMTTGLDFKSSHFDPVLEKDYFHKKIVWHALRTNAYTFPTG